MATDDVLPQQIDDHVRLTPYIQEAPLRATSSSEQTTSLVHSLVTPDLRKYPVKKGDGDAVGIAAALGGELDGGAEEPMSLMSGAKLGPYEIVSTLGAGGMGVVYLATDSRLDRQVAIKALPERLVRPENLIGHNYSCAFCECRTPGCNEPAT